jgi:hypothetical protein
LADAVGFVTDQELAVSGIEPLERSRQDVGLVALEIQQFRSVQHVVADEAMRMTIVHGRTASLSDHASWAVTMAYACTASPDRDFDCGHFDQCFLRQVLDDVRIPHPSADRCRTT